MPPKDRAPKKDLKRKRAPPTSSPPQTARRKLSRTDTTAILDDSDDIPYDASAAIPQPLIRLSLPLGQKIHKLICISREIEAIWRGWFLGGRAEAALRMAQLETQYDISRDEVEADLHATCLEMGLEPSVVLKGLPVFPSTHRAKESISVRPKIPKRSVFDLEYSIDKELRSKRNKMQGYDGFYEIYCEGEEEEEEEEEEMEFHVLQPIGVTRGQIPLTQREKEAMIRFTWRAKSAKAKQDDVSVSPNGTEMVYW